MTDTARSIMTEAQRRRDVGQHGERLDLASKSKEHGRGRASRLSTRAPSGLDEKLCRHVW